MKTLTKDELEHLYDVYLEKLMNGGIVLNGVLEKLELMIDQHHECIASMGSPVICSLCGKDLR